MNNLISWTLLINQMLLLTWCGRLIPLSPSPADPPYLRGVPPELREKILAFHRVLSTPDNFTSQTPAPAVETTRSAPSGGGFGLQEVSKDDELKKKSGVEEDTGELQNDLFRFSSKVTVPHSVHSNIDLSSRQNFVNFIQRKEKLRQRIQQEWKRFMKWRTQKRKKKRLKRRIMRTLNQRLKNQFGRLGLSGKRTKEEMKAFNRRKKILKRKIKRRLRQKQKINISRKAPGRASLPEQRLKVKARNLRKGKRSKSNKKTDKAKP